MGLQFETMDTNTIDSRKASRSTEDKNPCWAESKVSFKCLDDNGYDRGKCMEAFNNYNICKKFCGEVRVKRYNAGVEPWVPPPEDREAMRAKYAETGKIPTTPDG